MSFKVPREPLIDVYSTVIRSARCMSITGVDRPPGRTGTHRSGENPWCQHALQTHLHCQETGRKHHCRLITPIASWTQPHPTPALWWAPQRSTSQNHQSGFCPLTVALGSPCQCQSVSIIVGEWIDTRCRAHIRGSHSMNPDGFDELTSRHP